MKDLYIVRHAKSSWEDPMLRDHDRPLLPIGVRKTKRIVEFLKRRNVNPALLLSSTAKRAFETARIIARGIGYPEGSIRTSEKLYHGSTDTLLNELYSLPDEIDSVMLFGHNPALTYFVNQYLHPPIENLPTSGIVSVRFDTSDWAGISASKYMVNFMVTPKSLKDS